MWWELYFNDKFVPYHCTFKIHNEPCLHDKWIWCLVVCNSLNKQLHLTVNLRINCFTMEYKIWVKTWTTHYGESKKRKKVQSKSQSCKQRKIKSWNRKTVSNFWRLFSFTAHWDLLSPNIKQKRFLFFLIVLGKSELIPIILRNARDYSPNKMASHPRQWQKPVAVSVTKDPKLIQFQVQLRLSLSLDTHLLCENAAIKNNLN